MTDDEFDELLAVPIDGVDEPLTRQQYADTVLDELDDHRQVEDELEEAF
jgi:hypothetical protein